MTGGTALAFYVSCTRIHDVKEITMDYQGEVELHITHDRNNKRREIFLEHRVTSLL